MPPPSLARLLWALGVLGYQPSPSWLRDAADTLEGGLGALACSHPQDLAHALAALHLHLLRPQLMSPHPSSTAAAAAAAPALNIPSSSSSSSSSSGGGGSSSSSSSSKQPVARGSPYCPTRTPPDARVAHVARVAVQAAAAWRECASNHLQKGATLRRLPFPVLSTALSALAAMNAPLGDPLLPQLLPLPQPAALPAAAGTAPSQQSGSREGVGGGQQQQQQQQQQQPKAPPLPSASSWVGLLQPPSLAGPQLLPTGLFLQLAAMELGEQLREGRLQRTPLRAREQAAAALLALQLRAVEERGRGGEEEGLVKRCAPAVGSFVQRALQHEQDDRQWERQQQAGNDGQQQQQQEEPQDAAAAAAQGLRAAQITAAAVQLDEFNISSAYMQHMLFANMQQVRTPCFPTAPTLLCLPCTVPIRHVRAHLSFLVGASCPQLLLPPCTIMLCTASTLSLSSLPPLSGPANGSSSAAACLQRRQPAQRRHSGCSACAVGAGHGCRWAAGPQRRCASMWLMFGWWSTSFLDLTSAASSSHQPAKDLTQPLDSILCMHHTPLTEAPASCTPRCIHLVPVLAPSAHVCYAYDTAYHKYGVWRRANTALRLAPPAHAGTLSSLQQVLQQVQLVSPHTSGAGDSHPLLYNPPPPFFEASLAVVQSCCAASSRGALLPGSSTSTASSSRAGGVEGWADGQPHALVSCVAVLSDWVGLAQHQQGSSSSSSNSSSRGTSPTPGDLSLATGSSSGLALLLAGAPGVAPVLRAALTRMHAQLAADGGAPRGGAGAAVWCQALWVSQNLALLDAAQQGSSSSGSNSTTTTTTSSSSSSNGSSGSGSSSSSGSSGSSSSMPPPLLTIPSSAHWGELLAPSALASHLGLSPTLAAVYLTRLALVRRALHGSGAVQRALRGSGAVQRALRGSGAVQRALRGSGAVRCALRGSGAVRCALRGSGVSPLLCLFAVSQTLPSSSPYPPVTSAAQAHQHPLSAPSLASRSLHLCSHMLTHTHTHIRPSTTFAGAGCARAVSVAGHRGGRRCCCCRGGRYLWRTHALQRMGLAVCAGVQAQLRVCANNLCTCPPNPTLPCPAGNGPPLALEPLNPTLPPLAHPCPTLVPPCPLLQAVAGNEAVLGLLDARMCGQVSWACWMRACAAR